MQIITGNEWFAHQQLEGQPRYQHYLGLSMPKAFVITEKGGWFFSSDTPNAIGTAFEACAKIRAKCWLYAVDHTVVWHQDVEARIGPDQLEAR